LHKAKDGILWCFIPTAHFITGKTFKVVHRESDPTIKNADNSCKDYERKWYKFFT
jgi:hypothetical protein